MAVAIQGLDKQDAPPAELGKRMLDEIGGHWWNVYIGGPYYKGRGWTPAMVREYVRHGVKRFMLTYVGQQKGGTLTRARGMADGHDAVRLAKSFGYTGRFPLCLDIEQKTYDSAPSATIEYARAWCVTVLGHGARPGIYANPGPLKGMHGHVPADFVWVASWVSHHAGPRAPRDAPHMPAQHWPNPSQRAWQYAGEFGGVRCQVLGQNVDINVSDVGLLAHAPGVEVEVGVEVGAAAAARRHVMARGASGAPVLQLTTRLSFVPSPRTGKPYLDGPRRRLDAKSETALKAFQSEHKLKPTGTLDPTSAHALLRAVRLEQGRRRHVQPKPKPSGNGSRLPTRAPAAAAARGPSLVGLVDEFRRLDAQADGAWKAILAYGGARAEALEKKRDDDVNLADVSAILLRIEDKLTALIDAERQHAAQEPSPPTATMTATAHEVVEHAGDGDGELPQVAGHTTMTLESLSDEELQRHVDRLDQALDRSRAVVIARYARVEKSLGPAAPARVPAPPNGGGVVAEPAAKPVPAARPAKLPESDRVRAMQRLLNRFTQRHLIGFAPLAVDGKKGPATKRRIRDVRYYLGYTGTDRLSTTIDRELLNRIQSPRSSRRSNPAMLARSARRRRLQRKNARRSLAPRAGVARFEGTPVAAWIKPHLVWARKHGWQGSVVSGYRSPEHSEEVCKRMCGKPKCPGKCAGRTSNHSGRVKPHGAVDVDVTHAATFRALMQRSPHQPRIFNALPSDRNHFSATGR